MQGMYSMRSPAVKRLMKEAQELREPTEQFYAQPLEDNLFEWHFTIRGPEDSEFHGGIYHGRIVLPPEYPMKPPSIILLTPNGRFEVYKKICLSISGHHPESWQPSWSIRTALLAIIGFMPTHGNGAIGSLDYTPEERKVLAKKTQSWKCSTCGDVTNILLPVTAASEKTREEARELATQINFQAEKEKPSSGTNSSSPNLTESAVASSSGLTPQSPSPTAFPHPGQAGLPPFGQFPFAGFPFPPPFMPPPNLAQGGDNTGQTNVPRFPLPFFPPMFTPPFPAMAGGGMPMPPWGANQGTGATPTTAPTLTRTSSSTNTSSVGSPSDAQSSPKVGKPADKSVQTPQQSPVPTDSSTSGKTSEPRGNQESDTNDASKTSDSSNSTRNPSSPRTTVNPASSTAPNPASQSTNHGNGARLPNQNTGASQVAGVRQRNTGTSATVPRTTPLSARPAAQPQHTGGTFSLVMIILLCIAIGCLLFRRFFLSSGWHFQFRNW